MSNQISNQSITFRMLAIPVQNRKKNNKNHQWNTLRRSDIGKLCLRVNIWREIVFRFRFFIGKIFLISLYSNVFRVRSIANSFFIIAQSKMDRDAIECRMCAVNKVNEEGENSLIAQLLFINFIFNRNVTMHRNTIRNSGKNLIPKEFCQINAPNEHKVNHLLVSTYRYQNTK